MGQAAVKTAEQTTDAVAVTDYIDTLSMIERLHRQLLDVIKDELDRSGVTELNSVQALLIFNINAQELTAGELRTRGHYLGSNVSYNLKKLVELGFLSHERSTADRRTVRIALTEKGEAVRAQLHALFARQAHALPASGGVMAEELSRMNVALSRLQRYWLDHIRFRL
ncbi:MAG: MarR family winged helix-turn-helix transcriptional regulator [Maricaulaceae bacterium]